MYKFKDFKFRRLREFELDYNLGYSDSAVIKNNNVEYCARKNQENNLYSFYIKKNDKMVICKDDCNSDDIDHEMIKYQRDNIKDYINDIIPIIRKFSSVVEDFDSYVFDIYQEFYKAHMELNGNDDLYPNPLYICTISTTGISKEDGVEYIEYSWSEDWICSGGDSGNSRIPLSWITNTEEELKKYREKLSNKLD